MKKYAIITLITCLCLACTHEKRDADTKNIKLDITFQRFEQDFWQLRNDTANIAQNLETLHEKYPVWTDDYLCRVLEIGRHYNDSSVLYILPKFLNDSSVTAFYTDAMNAYADITDIEKALTEAFKRAKYFFPETETPQCYTHVSGLNQSICVGDGYISVSIDNYMGSDYPVYQGRIYDYLLPNMRREMILPDIVHAWIEAEFPFYPQEGELLEDMLYEGKLVYITSILLPNLHDTLLMGYNSEQLEWCQKSEPAMWDKMVEEGHLFTHESVMRSKYLHSAPFTTPFTQNSPGRGGVYIGWRIIESYMSKNKNVTPLQLMQETNYRNILEKSEYNPQ
ncbi:MAG: hypothetical protein Q4D14_01870 [Bacteroidales bacterium]|nr:hypothetical protein [Bacteroidales bacterium]